MFAVYIRFTAAANARINENTTHVVVASFRVKNGKKASWLNLPKFANSMSNHHVQMLVMGELWRFLFTRGVYSSRICKNVSCQPDDTLKLLALDHGFFQVCLISVFLPDNACMLAITEHSHLAFKLSINCL
jgi:hypothetical protein